MLKKSRFIKEQEASELLNSLGIKASLSRIPWVAPLLFSRYKMNEIGKKLLLAEDKFLDLLAVLVDHLLKIMKEYKK